VDDKSDSQLINALTRTVNSPSFRLLTRRYAQTGFVFAASTILILAMQAN
jgi:hypothetical protein